MSSNVIQQKTSIPHPNAIPRKPLPLYKQHYPNEIKVKVTPEQVEVTWPDGHVSVFDEAWLRERCFSEENIRKRRAIIEKAKPVLWDAEFGSRIGRHNFQRVMTDDEALLEFLKGMRNQRRNVGKKENVSHYP